MNDSKVLFEIFDMPILESLDAENIKLSKEITPKNRITVKNKFVNH